MNCNFQTSVLWSLGCCFCGIAFKEDDDDVTYKLAFLEHMIEFILGPSSEKSDGAEAELAKKAAAKVIK